MTDLATCPNCRQSLRVPPSLIGRRLKCPACASDFDPVLAPPRPRDEPPARDYPDDDRWDDRPVRRSRRDEDEHDDDYPRRDRPRDRRRDEPKPSKVQAIGVMMLVGGILNCVLALSLLVFSCGILLIWPGTYVAIVAGILCIIRGSTLIGERADRESPPIAPAVLQIVCILNVDLVNVTLGIVELIMLNDSEVRRYLRP
jgi:hypothetical protein